VTKPVVIKPEHRVEIDVDRLALALLELTQDLTETETAPFVADGADILARLELDLPRRTRRREVAA